MTNKPIALTAFLTRPGRGIFAVNAHHDNTAAIDQALYAEESPDDTWHDSLSHLRHVRSAILGLPSDTGGGICRGAAWGPFGIREALYETKTPELDIGDIRVNPQLLEDRLLNEQTIASCRQAMYGDAHAPYPVSPLTLAAYVLEEIYRLNPDIKLLGLGGDHSCSYPFVMTTLQHYAAMGKRIGLIHFDAHTDLLRERMGIPVCFGSWTSHVLDSLTTPEDCIQIGIRATAHTRSHWENEFGIKQYFASEFDHDAILKHIHQQPWDGVYITFDIDALDSSIASATGTPESGGLQTEDCIRLIDAICEHAPLIGADIMEVAPYINRNGNPNEPASTLEAATDIAKCFMAKWS